jgi:hypothetical protein
MGDKNSAIFGRALWLQMEGDAVTDRHETIVVKRKVPSEDEYKAFVAGYME